MSDSTLIAELVRAREALRELATATRLLNGTDSPSHDTITRYALALDMADAVLRHDPVPTIDPATLDFVY